MDDLHAQPPSYYAATTDHTTYPRKGQADTLETQALNINRSPFAASSPLVDDQSNRIGEVSAQSYFPNTSAPNYTPNTVYEKSFNDKLKAFLGKLLLVVIVAAGIYIMITNYMYRKSQVISDTQDKDLDDEQSGKLEKQ